MTDEVIDSAQSIVFDQSENRLHTEKGLLVWMIYPNLKQPTEGMRKSHLSAINALLPKALL